MLHQVPLLPRPKPTLPCSPETLDEFLSQPSPAVIDFVASWTGNILVLGAGGKMGLHLCRMLKSAVAATNASAKIIAVSRFTTLRDRASFESAGIPTIACDLADPAQLAALPDAAAVYFLAGLKFGSSATPDLLHTMNVLVPRLVAERYRSARIAAFSTGCVYPFVSTDSPGANESIAPAPVGEYALSCLGREKEFAAGSEKSGTPVVLIRLNYAVEFRYGVLVDIATKVRDAEVIDVTMGHVNVIWQRDAVEQIILSLSLAASPAVPINITGPTVLSVRRIAEDFGQLMGRAPQFKGTEAPTAWLNDATRSHALWGRPPTSLQAMESWIAAWLLANGKMWGKPTGFEKRDGKF